MLSVAPVTRRPRKPESTRGHLAGNSLKLPAYGGGVTAAPEHDHGQPGEGEGEALGAAVQLQGLGGDAAD